MRRARPIAILTLAVAAVTVPTLPGEGHRTKAQRASGRFGSRIISR